MKKNLKDLKAATQNETINLRSDNEGKLKKETSRLKKKKYAIKKKKIGISEVKDLDSGRKTHYLYIKGKKFTPPKFLGNLLKVALFGFLIIIIINSVNVYYTGKKLEKDISSQAAEGYSFLIDAGKSATKIQFDNAIITFEKALVNFSQAEDQLWFVSTDKSFYSQDDNIGQAVGALLEGGKYFAIAGGYFLEALEEFNKIPLYFVSRNVDSKTEHKSITDALKIGLEKTNLAIEQITMASEKLATVSEKSLPSEIRARVKLAKNTVEEVAKTLEATSKHFPALLKLLGDRYPHRYLILLQNNLEIRPTGGFIGSYAIMDVNEGYIESLETYDSYDIDGSYGGFIEPPDELKNFTSNWRFRDSNYSPDFPTSAAKARWFLQKEGGPTVDTVIAINQGLLKDMLEITGPIQVGSFGELDADNYNLLLSYIIEGKIWGPEDPKHILKVFVPAFKDAILKEENIGKVGSKLYRAIQQKHIMIYSSDTEIQAFLDSLGISGRVYENEENEDYISVIHSAIGGTKSEGFIDEEITHDTFIDETGQLIDEIKIKRTHGWTDDVYYEWARILKKYGFTEMPDELIDILGRGRNRVVTRIYVPAGSILLESNGEDVVTAYDKDLKKTYFMAKMEVSAGDTTELTIKYSLPFTLDFNNPASTYKLVIEKQSGSRGSLFTKTVHTHPDINNLAVYPAESRFDQEGTIIYNTNLVYDRYFSGIWGK